MALARRSAPDGFEDELSLPIGKSSEQFLCEAEDDRPADQASRRLDGECGSGETGAQHQQAEEGGERAGGNLEPCQSQWPW